VLNDEAVGLDINVQKKLNIKIFCLPVCLKIQRLKFTKLILSLFVSLKLDPHLKENTDRRCLRWVLRRQLWAG